MWCAVDNHKFMCYVCAKGFYIEVLIDSLLTKYQFSTKLPQTWLFKSMHEK